LAPELVRHAYCRIANLFELRRSLQSDPASPATLLAGLVYLAQGLGGLLGGKSRGGRVLGGVLYTKNREHKFWALSTAHLMVLARLTAPSSAPTGQTNLRVGVRSRAGILMVRVHVGISGVGATPGREV